MGLVGSGWGAANGGAIHPELRFRLMRSDQGAAHTGASTLTSTFVQKDHESPLVLALCAVIELFAGSFHFPVGWSVAVFDSGNSDSRELCSGSVARPRATVAAGSGKPIVCESIHDLVHGWV